MCIQLQISVVWAPSALRVWVLTSSSVSAGSLSQAGTRKVMVWSSATPKGNSPVCQWMAQVLGNSPGKLIPGVLGPQPRDLSLVPLPVLKKKVTLSLWILISFLESSFYRCCYGQWWRSAVPNHFLVGYVHLVQDLLSVCLFSSWNGWDLLWILQRPLIWFIVLPDF